MLRTRLIARFESLGRVAPAEADIDVLLNAFEYVGYRVALSDPGDETTVDWARTTMARLAIGLLGTTSDVEFALPLSEWPVPQCALAPPVRLAPPDDAGWVGVASAVRAARR